MITSNFFIDFNLIKDKNRIRDILIKNGMVRRSAFDYLENLIKKYSMDVKYNPTMDKETFAVVIWIIRYINEKPLISRFITDQRDVFQNKIAGLSLENYDNVIEYFSSLGIEDASIKAIDNKYLFKISFDIFIRYNKKLSGNKYRLIYQMLDNGYVYIDLNQVSHILREYFVVEMYNIYNEMENPNDIFEGFYDKLDELKKEFIEINRKNTMNLGDVDSSIFPPCIKEYINEINDGGNPSHMARLTLATFLHHIGMDNNGIVKIFSRTADFDENSAAYQVNHLTGNISGTEYSPPKCATLKSNHLCYMGDDPLCKMIKHPLQYYETKARYKIRKNKL